MNCADLLRKLTDYDEGSLPGTLCAEIERHLRDCQPCGELRRDLEDLARLCRASETPRLPEDVRRRIEQRLRETPDSGER